MEQLSEEATQLYISTTPPEISTPERVLPRYHPEFTASSMPDADIILVARDGLRFRISANVLKSASRTFETMLSLPQPIETDQKEPIIDSLDEDSEIIADLLRMISGKEILPSRLESLDVLDALLLAAKKWEMYGPVSILRVLLCTNPEVSTRAIRVYWFGCRFGWKDLTAMGSKHSCNNDFYRVELQPLLRTFDAVDLLRLMQFHRDRAQNMKNFLVITCIASSPLCGHLQITMGDKSQYLDFAWRVLDEIDRTPPARPLSKDLLESLSIASGLRASGMYARCPTLGCGQHVSSPEVIQNILNHWNTLQKSI